MRPHRHCAMKTWSTVHPLAKKLWKSRSFMKETMRSRKPITKRRRPEKESKVQIRSWSWGMDTSSFWAVSITCPKV
ncbi:hypothetical protein EV1_034234 [Malus domestica]